MFAATGGKRPRSPLAPIRRPSGPVIDLTSDDDETPEPKRAKSGTPGTTKVSPPVRPSLSNLKPPPPPPQNIRQSTYFDVTQASPAANESFTSSNAPLPWPVHSPATSVQPQSNVNGAHRQRHPQHTGNAIPASTTVSGVRPSPARSYVTTKHTQIPSQPALHAKQHHSNKSNAASSPTTFHVPNTPPLRFSPVGQQIPNPNKPRKHEPKTSMISKNFSTSSPESFKIDSPQPLKFDPHQSSTKRAKKPALPNGVQSAKQAEADVTVKARPGSPQISTPTIDIPKSNALQGTRGNAHNSIPIRQSPTPSSSQRGSTTSTRPSQLAQTLAVDIPSPKKGIVINVPLSDDRRRRREMIERLKTSTELAKTGPEEVEKVLGQFGFSAFYSTNLDQMKYAKAAQPKKRKVDRAAIKLDLSGKRRHKSKDLVSSMQTLSLIHPQEQVKAILTDRFGEQYDPPITFSNDINDNRLNGKFQFVPKYIFRKGVKLGGHLAKPSCKCAGPCEIDCTCFMKLIKDSYGQRYLQMQFYRKRPDGLLVLTDDYIDRYDTEGESRVEISECNENCSCPPSCTNRVVQKGRTVPLNIFQTQRCGFGVRSTQTLAKGQFIELYLGEVITEAELRRRESAQEEHETSYIYSLDWFETHSPNNVCHVDGANFGSAMRFVNHSCNPNARPFTVLNSRSTKQIHDVAFFAVRDIPAGTEITIDYSPQMQGEIHDVDDDDDVVQCLCGSTNCRGKLWRPGQERRVNKKRLRDIED